MEVEIVLSAVIAVCTLVYTVINALMLNESKLTRKVKNTPNIIAFLKSTEDHLNLCLHIKNIGEGLGVNLRVDILKDYKLFNKEGDLLSDVGIVKNGFNYFPPQYEVRYCLNTNKYIGENEGKQAIELLLTYESTDKVKFRKEIVLPFNQLAKQTCSDPPDSYIGKISKSVEGIRKILEK